jgi:hypothetical protein
MNRQSGRKKSLAIGAVGGNAELMIGSSAVASLF